MMAAQTEDLLYSKPIIHLPDDLQGKQIIQLYMYFVHLHVLISLRSNETFVCKKNYILMVLPTANLLISGLYMLLFSLYICNFCFCSNLAAAVMKWDKEATEATIKYHAAEHLKHGGREVEDIQGWKITEDFCMSNVWHLCLFPLLGTLYTLPISDQIS